MTRASPVPSWFRNSARARATPSTSSRTPLDDFAICRMRPTVPTRARSEGAGSSASTFCCSISTMRSPASARLIASTETARFTDSGAAVRGNTTVRRSGRTGSSDGIWGGGGLTAFAIGVQRFSAYETRGRRSIGDAPGCFEGQPRHAHKFIEVYLVHVVFGSVVVGVQSRSSERAPGCHARGTTIDRFDAPGCVSRRRRTCGHRGVPAAFASRTASVRSGLCGIPEQVQHVGAVFGPGLRQSRETRVRRIRNIFVPPDHVEVEICDGTARRRRVTPRNDAIRTGLPPRRSRMRRRSSSPGRAFAAAAVANASATSSTAATPDPSSSAPFMTPRLGSTPSWSRCAPMTTSSSRRAGSAPAIAATTLQVLTGRRSISATSVSRPRPTSGRSFSARPSVTYATGIAAISAGW